MAITTDQALSFYDALLQSKPMRFHIEAVLGYGKSPGKASDYESNNADVLDRCEELLEHVTECTELLRTIIRDRPRQQNFEFPEGEGETDERPKRRGRRKS